MSAISARHLLICREIVHNPDLTGTSYSLIGLTVSMRPDDDFGYPLTAERLCLLAQLFGEPGEYNVAIDLVEIDELNEIEEILETFGPKKIRIEVGRFVQSVSLILGPVRFPNPGLYEFRLLLSDEDEVLIAERILLEV